MVELRIPPNSFELNSDPRGTSSDPPTTQWRSATLNDTIDQHRLFLDDHTLLTNLNLPSSTQTRKRNLQEANYPLASLGSDHIPQWFRDQFPDFVPSISPLSEHKYPFGLQNPFENNGTIIHPRLEAGSKPQAPLVQSGAVNGLVKFRMLRKERDSQRSAQSQLQHRMDEAEDRARAEHPFLRPLPNLPADFGRGLKLDATDAFLFKFYTLAFCGGRTLLPQTNAFLNEVTPMASANFAVKYAILSLAASYVLDYRPSKPLQLRAQAHHKRAVLLLGQELNRPETFAPGRGEAALAVLMLLSHNDLVNWELDRCRSLYPKWYTGYQMANLVLAKTDPGYTYHEPQNVQYSRARRFIGTKAALQIILAEVFGPLEFPKACPHSWLLTGDDDSLNKIDGLIGLSPKLLHLYAQVTHLASRLYRNPNSVVIARAARFLWPRIHLHRQKSDLSEGPEDLSSLLAACAISSDLDPRTGKINSRTTVVELTAESYTSAAELYFLCRLLRYPRSHPLVRKTLSQLLECISYQPTDGILFTAQAPLFPVFVAGAVSLTEQDRKIVNAWFDGVNMSSRGNIPPNRRAMTAVWEWLDNDLTPSEAPHAYDEWTDTQDVIQEGFGQRRAWWEEMVQMLEQTEGRMSLG
ncbi:hypothetical protein B0A52_01182 [Exophiala mesophila]|uniref:Transcription factor domain-containing protein n=1 Tax=Exophiala mesophila TaxID=212818 RepID=A0A438NGP0_EXOME|nr:hypothetical protein B0A52_01182 [Exophiala mesophila]